MFLGYFSKKAPENHGKSDKIETKLKFTFSGRGNSRNELPETNYLNVYFDYIHQNPVNDKLVDNLENLEFSSCRNYYCRRKRKLINHEVTKELRLNTLLNDHYPMTWSYRITFGGEQLKEQQW